MFEKILIANRGEIACRIIRTCRRLGIATVAVYSEADADALHVRMADERVLLGPPPAAESYLRIDRLVEAARSTGAEAVHPGYGFLSESAAFAQALEDAGIAFIGPPAAAIEAMGDKIESKRLAKAAGVPIVPGIVEPVRDAADAIQAARSIGYPVMIKAAAGGGGKGMRVARGEGELLECLERASAEARSLVRRRPGVPREVRRGAAPHRDPGAGRPARQPRPPRRARVLDPAPAPEGDRGGALAVPRRGDAAGRWASRRSRLARAVGYHSAGTVEFLVDEDRDFYFLEMNTRLQVEHPVTELVTGLDLVELMIRVAAGERLPFGQEDVRLNGWAIEGRVYAEDPRRGFLPSVGRLVRYEEPAGEGVRVDSGICEGGEVSLFYDPMIAKLCASGPDRATATRRLREALDAFVIRGPGHNIPFLAAVLANPRFAEGRLSTGFIAEEYGERFRGGELPEDQRRQLAAVAAAMGARTEARSARISGRMPGWTYEPTREWTVELGGEGYPVATRGDAGEEVAAEVAGTDIRVRLDWRPGERRVEALVDGRPLVLQADPVPEGWRLTHGGAELTTLVRTRQAAEYAARIPEKAPPDTSRLVRSPMPGLIISVQVRPGQEVKVGQELCVLEAMKMENVLRAERDGTVAEVKVAPRDTVAADQVLLAFA